MTDDLPTTREGWEHDYPIFQPRFLAYCNAMRQAPINTNTIEFMSWINYKAATFRSIRGIKGDCIPEGEGKAFTSYLWGEA